MIIESCIAQELDQIAHSMAAAAPREQLDDLITRKRQEQGISLCKANDELQPLASHVAIKSIDRPK